MTDQNETYTNFNFNALLDTSIISKPPRFRNLIIGDSLLRDQTNMFTGDETRVVCIPGATALVVMHFLNDIFDGKTVRVKETGINFDWDQKKLDQINKIILMVGSNDLCNRGASRYADVGSELIGLRGQKIVRKSRYSTFNGNFTPKKTRRH